MPETWNFLKDISSSPPSKEELKLILSLIDLTSLETTDTEEKICALSEKSSTYKTAAVCVYPKFVLTAKNALKGTTIKVASVAGDFPAARLPLPARLEEARFALSQGADEIDMVISRDKFLAGDHKEVTEEVSAFKKVCKEKTLKVILETGELQTEHNISTAAKLAIDSGADFIKTSTGKIPVGATPEAVWAMLTAIKTSGKKVGIKPSGGIASPEAAVMYLRMTETVLGSQWLVPGLLRFGASRLADQIYTQL